MNRNMVVAEQEMNYLQTADSIRAQVNRIQEVMRSVMIGPTKDHPQGVHYGVIPGTDKPTLYKPGAEVLQATFRIAPSYKVEDLSTPDCVRYRVTCIGTHQLTSIVLGEGMGEASSNEGKYKWCKAASNKDFDATPADRRRIKYGYNKKEKREYETKQVRTDIADVANTILKMACKRAQVAMVLNVTAASDIFTQDIEDMPEELRDTDDAEQQEPRQTQAKQPAQKPPYPDDKFKSMLPDWKKAVTEGVKTANGIQKKTPQVILSTIQSKYTLTNEQHDTILNIATLNIEGDQQQ